MNNVVWILNHILYSKLFLIIKKTEEKRAGLEGDCPSLIMIRVIIVHFKSPQKVLGEIKSEVSQNAVPAAT